VNPNERDRASLRARRILGTLIAGTVAAVVLIAGVLVSAGPATAATSKDVSANGSSLSFTLEHGAASPFEPNQPNLAYRTVPDSPLLLFLAATRAHPADYRAFLNSAETRGYHVLALDYWNTGLSVEKTCGMDPQCYTQLQSNRLTGENPNRFSAVSHRNSIVNRLRVSINYLHKSDPAGDWQRFVSGKHIHWSRIVVAGHSQGGGESAYIAHIHSVRGALFYSSPVDTNRGIAASWMGSPGATPASRMYGFVDSGDMFYNRIRGSWRELGMNTFGPPADAADTGHFDSHEIVSTADLGRPDQSHLRTVTDKTPRTESGRPQFRTVWNWMLAQLYTPPKDFHAPDLDPQHIVTS
jgi:hypothetical protein